MGLGGCYTCIKYLMFTFNLLFWILGCALLGVGIWVRVDPNFADTVSIANVENLYAGSYLLIAVGTVIMILGFLGCCGAIKESQCMLATFFVFLFIIFAVLLAAGIWAATNQSELEEELTKGMQESIKKAKDGDAEMKNNLQAFQKTYTCCGASGPQDWGLTLDTCELSTRITGPGCVSRMKTKIEANLLIITGVGIGIGVVMPGAVEMHRRGCGKVLAEKFRGALRRMLAVTIAVGAVTIFGMIFALMLCCAIRDTKG